MRGLNEVGADRQGWGWLSLAWDGEGSIGVLGWKMGEEGASPGLCHPHYSVMLPGISWMFQRFPYKIGGAQLPAARAEGIWGRKM